MKAGDESLPATFGPYTLLAELGRGAAGVVYLAERRDLGAVRKRVAIKIVRPDRLVGDAGRELFLREARIACRVDHPNVVSTLSAGEIDGRGYIEMEHVSGQTLSAECVSAATDAPRLLDIATQVAQGLGAIHDVEDQDGKRLGVVHRDLKPANVMVTRGGTIKVMDFSIAKATADSVQLTDSETIRGTPPYMAPESLRGAAVDGRADLFAWGALVGELALGRPLFYDPKDPGTLAEVVAAVLQVEERIVVRDAIVACERLVPGLGALVESCLRKQASKRPASAGEVIATLRKLGSRRHSRGAWVERGVAAGLGLGIGLAALPFARGGSAPGPTIVHTPPQVEFPVESRLIRFEAELSGDEGAACEPELHVRPALDGAPFESRPLERDPQRPGRAFVARWYTPNVEGLPGFDYWIDVRCRAEPAVPTAGTEAAPIAVRAPR